MNTNSEFHSMHSKLVSYFARWMLLIVAMQMLLSCKVRNSASELEGVYYEGKTLASKTQRVCIIKDIDTNNAEDDSAPTLPSQEILQQRAFQNFVVSGAEFNRRLKVAETVVRKQFARVGFTFSGWKACNKDDNASLRVLINDTRPFGFAGCKNAESWCVSLNLTFLQWPNSKYCKSNRKNDKKSAPCYCKDEAYVDNCIKIYALHEFGHAVGLGHETLHTGSKNCITYEKENDSDAISHGKYDEDSIMNYCKNYSQIIDNITPVLSTGNIDVLKKLYQ